MSLSPTEIAVQGTLEWHKKRVGKVTASRVADIIRTSRTKGQPSASRTRYLGELVSERLTGQPTMDGFKSADMMRGNEVEAEARDHYAVTMNAAVTRIDFVDHPIIAMTGASPDAFVDGDGLLELKCPATHTYLEVLRGAPIDPDYLTQMHWQMACTGRVWCDFVNYDNRLPAAMRMHRQRVMRDPKRIAELETEVRRFQKEIEDTIAELDAMFASKAEKAEKAEKAA